MPPHLALNTAASFVTNTSWQFYGGESTLSYLSQMAGIAVQMFLSAGVGMAVLAAVVRGFSRRSRSELGNFWVDLYRSLVYVLLPLSLVLAAILVWQGVPQTFDGHATATTLQGATQTIARGPVASQEAIKNLSMDGGGFYNANSAVPFENPNGLSNFVEMLSLLLIPVAQVFMFGRMVARAPARVGGARGDGGDVRRRPAVVAAAEQHGSPVLRDSGVDITAGHGQSGGNMTDKEVRFGIANTALFATATTASSDGAVNGGMDAFTPAGGAVPLANMFVGEVIFGGVGSGLYSMLFMIVIAVFVAGLHGRPDPGVPGQEDRGARDQARRARGAVHAGARADADGVSIASTPGSSPSSTPARTASPRRSTPGPRWRTRTAARSRATGARASARQLGAVAMILGRYVPLVAALALAGSRREKRSVPASAGTLRTDGPTFVVLLVGVIVLTAGLMLLPALALGPIVEGLGS